ncbi:MAG: hypothetical protein EBX57_12530, partial [Betaproteobacteria bacterium]|nr:hypothetical protein [Betaproteobacteria bacterium]
LGGEPGLGHGAARSGSTNGIRHLGALLVRVGGPLAWVQTGDRIRLSVARRELSLLVDAETLQQRMLQQPLKPPQADRGYRQLFLREVLQAEAGVDFDFLRKAPEGL